MKLTSVIAALIALACTGCVGPLVPVTKVDESTASELAQSIRVYEATETPRRAVVVSALTATSCMNKVWDKPATKDDAVAQLRHQARASGANAIGNLTCENIEGTNLAKNCWNSVTCTGSALKISEARR